MQRLTHSAIEAVRAIAIFSGQELCRGQTCEHHLCDPRTHSGHIVSTVGDWRSSSCSYCSGGFAEAASGCYWRQISSCSLSDDEEPSSFQFSQLTSASCYSQSGAWPSATHASAEATKGNASIHHARQVSHCPRSLIGWKWYPHRRAERVERGGSLKDPDAWPELS